MNRNKINLIIDLLLFLNLAAVAGIGLLIKYILPPGREQILKYGENAEWVSLGWDRHQWGDLHLVLAYVLIGLLVLHIVLHWNVIKCLFRQLAPLPWLRQGLLAGCAVLGALLLLFPFVVRPEKQAGDFLHRNSRAALSAVAQPQADQTHKSDAIRLHENRHAPNESTDDIAPEQETTVLTKGLHRQAQHDTLHATSHHEQGESALHGKMTIAEVGRTYGISTSTVKKRLGVPESVSDQQTMGRLRRAYGFTMEQARSRLAVKQPAVEKTHAPISQ